MDWRDRFRAPQFFVTKLASGRPGRGLVVGSKDGVSVQLFAWDVPGKQLVALTDAKLGVVDGWIDPSGTYVYYLRDEDGSELGHLVRVPFEGGPVQDITPKLAAYTLRGVGFGGSRLAFNPVNSDGFALYVLDVQPELGEPRLLFRDSWETWGALLSADADLAACWSTARARGLRRYTLLVFDTATGDQVAELDDGREAKVVGIRFSPVPGDGRVLASTNRTGFVRPVIWDPRTGERHDPQLPGLSGDVVPVDWSPDGGRILLCQLAGPQQLHSYDLTEHTVTRLDHPNGSYVIEIFGGVEYDADGDIVGVRGVAQTPSEVVRLDGRTGRQREVLLEPGAAPRGRPWRSVWVSSGDTPVHAWLSTPDGPGPFPTIVEAHGGPHFAAYEGYDPAAQAWLDHGYAWMSVNFRGSTGFGRAFTEQIWGDLGRWELADLAAAREWLVAEGIAVPEQVFLTGGSYGGYLTLLGLGRQPHLWAGGMALAADADMAACYEDSSDALKGALAGWMKGTPEERPEAYRISSPITYAADVTAPVLAIQARNDTRVPPRQMENYERRMRELGKDIEVVWLEGGHTSFGPEAFLHSTELMLAFAERIRNKT
ncbi:MAG TPA: prolyl oligopeptidase family serine peptidase [Micromonosporaceae bacterium]|nr:prolyl oligopeptidase family serine peptidase [Micromonosporaceae bacterium]